jgi:hypothetical protein
VLGIFADPDLKAIKQHFVIGKGIFFFGSLLLQSGDINEISE